MTDYDGLPALSIRRLEKFSRKRDHCKKTDKSPGVLLASDYIAGGALAGIILAIASVYFAETVGFFAEWATASNPFFEGPNSDWLGTVPFLILAVVLYLVGREILMGRKTPE